MYPDGMAQMNEDTPSAPILIQDSDSKRALAVFAHLRRIVETITKCDSLRPIQMDHADLLLCSASFRALLFDDFTPIFVKFCDSYGLNIQIECLETDIALVLLSWFVPDEVHLSDFLMHVLLDSEMRNSFPLDKEQRILHGFRDGVGWKGALKRPDLWIPDRAAQEKID